MLIDPASRLRSKKEHISVEIGTKLAPNHYVKCGDTRRGPRSEEEGVKEELGSESRPAAREDRSLSVLV
jgi:hypothetical protein